MSAEMLHSDELTADDLAKVIIGFYDKETGKRVPGMADAVRELSEYMLFARRIDSWLLRAAAIGILLHLFGVHDLQSFLSALRGGS